MTAPRGPWSAEIEEEAGGGAGSPGGADKQVQYNHDGVLGGIPNGSAGQVLTSNGAGAAPSFQAGGGSGVLQSATVTLSATEHWGSDDVHHPGGLYTLSASPVELVATPGGSKMSRVLHLTWQYKAGNTPYTVADGSQYFAVYSGGQSLLSTGANIWSAKQQGFFDQIVSQIKATDHDIDMEDAQSVFEDQPLLLSVYNNTLDPPIDMTDGNGIVIVTVYRSVVTLA